MKEKDTRSKPYRTLVEELVNIDGTTKVHSTLKQYQIFSLDTMTEIAVGRDIKKNTWFIKSFFNSTGKRVFYHYFPEVQFKQWSVFVSELNKVQDNPFEDVAENEPISAIPF